MSFILNIKKYNSCLLAIFFAAINLNSYSQEFKHLEIPKIHDHEYVINHIAYSLSYNENYKQANWVAYELTQEETTSAVKRSNKFVVDPEIKIVSADNGDYSKSGYDRGHLAPAGDMGWSETTMRESFFFSNISPQVPSFNRGIWKQAEELVRDWAKKYQKIYVVTGPIFTDEMKSIGSHNVAVPKYFYKVILKYNGSENSGIGFIIPNEKSEKELQTFAINIDSVEKITRIDFFPLLPDSLENKIEGDLNLNSWSWKPQKTHRKNKQKIYSN